MESAPGRTTSIIISHTAPCPFFQPQPPPKKRSCKREQHGALYIPSRNQSAVTLFKKVCVLKDFFEEGGEKSSFDPQPGEGGVFAFSGTYKGFFFFPVAIVGMMMRRRGQFPKDKRLQ